MTNTPDAGYVSSEYDATNFYIGSVDKRGHGSSMRVPDNVHSQILAVVNHDGFPYRSAQDFYRDAGVHRMHWLREHTDDESLRRVIDGYLAQMEAERIVDLVETVAQAVREIPERVKSMVEMGEMEAARTYLLRQGVYARSLPRQSGEKVSQAIQEAIRLHVLKK